MTTTKAETTCQKCHGTGTVGYYRFYSSKVMFCDCLVGIEAARHSLLTPVKMTVEADAALEAFHAANAVKSAARRARRAQS